MSALFWVSLALILYPYAGYPVLLWILRPFLQRAVRKAPATPPVTLVVSAFNEAANLKRKLDNTLELDYPAERLQILVVSDASTDATDWIAAGYAGRGVELIRLPERRGKAACQAAAVERATGDILVFTDARIELASGSLRAMMANFSDPEVGCVSSRDEIVDASGAADPTAGEGFYVRYEMALRAAEAAVGSLVGASGSFYAVRRALVGTWPAELERDFMTPLKVAAAGLRTVLEPEAVGYYGALPAPEAEFRRKVRTVMRGMAVLFHMREVLDPFRFPRFAWQVWSHKVLRWTVPFCLIALLAASAALAATGAVYALALAAQVALYTLALAAYLDRGLEARLAFRLPLFFANVNLSILVAWGRFLFGARQVTWEPSRR